jgi:cytochrome c
MNFKIFFVAVACLHTTLPAFAADGDVDAGRTAYNQCRPCHQIGADAQNSVGPVLNGVFGRKAGEYAGYNYSDANKGSGLTWDEANLRDYLKNPRAKVPGTKMIFPGITRETQMDNVIAFLKQLKANGDGAE